MSNKTKFIMSRFICIIISYILLIVGAVLYIIGNPYSMLFVMSGFTIQVWYDVLYSITTSVNTMFVLCCYVVLDIYIYYVILSNIESYIIYEQIIYSLWVIATIIIWVNRIPFKGSK